MRNQKQLEDLFIKHGFNDFKWIKGKDIKVAQWVRIKCMFGCNCYGKNSTCPPNVPSVSECRELFSEYDDAAIFHIQRIFEDEEKLLFWSNETNKKLSYFL